jgi:hypothetical protein
MLDKLKLTMAYVLQIAWKGGDTMDVIYATLIVKGAKKWTDVPTVIQPKVAQVLEQLGFPELAA